MIVFQMGNSLNPILLVIVIFGQERTIACGMRGAVTVQYCPLQNVTPPSSRNSSLNLYLCLRAYALQQ